MPPMRLHSLFCAVWLLFAFPMTSVRGSSEHITTSDTAVLLQGCQLENARMQEELEALRALLRQRRLSALQDDDSQMHNLRGGVEGGGAEGAATEEEGTEVGGGKGGGAGEETGGVGKETGRAGGNRTGGLLTHTHRRRHRVHSIVYDILDDLMSPLYLKNMGMATLCLCMAAVCAGLTMGLVSLEPHDMEVILRQEEADMPNDEERQRLRDDKEAAAKIAPLVKDHHRLLVTLLLLNSIANEALPIFLDAIFPSYWAIIVSVFGVLVFGEIIPSAVFTGSHQLKIAAAFSGIVACAESMLFPIAVPIAIVLDKCLGAEHKGRYNFAELRAVLGYHARLDLGPKHIIFQSVDDYGLGIITSQNPHNLGDDSQLIYNGSCEILEPRTVYHAKPCAPTRGKRDTGCTFKLYTSAARQQEDLVAFHPGELTDGWFEYYERDEVKIIKGVVSITSLTAAKVMKPLSEMWMLSTDTHLTRDKMVDIEASGFSRIPVYDTWPHNVRGYILAKSLIKVSPEEAAGASDRQSQRQVKDLDLKELVVEDPAISLLDLLNCFQEKRCHLGLLTNEKEKVMEAWRSGEPIPCDVHMAGCVTLEDIIEKILGEDIDDEHDFIKQTSQTNLEDAERPVRASSSRYLTTSGKKDGTKFFTGQKVGPGQKLAGQLVNHIAHHKSSPQLLEPLISVRERVLSSEE